jgi:hypothetical protein
LKKLERCCVSEHPTDGPDKATAELEPSPELERQLEQAVTRMVTVVFWVFAVCLSAFVVSLTTIALILLWRLV